MTQMTQSPRHRARGGHRQPTADSRRPPAPCPPARGCGLGAGGEGGTGPKPPPVPVTVRVARNFLFFAKSPKPHVLSQAMSFQSLPFAPREIKATEKHLQAIYDAARLGLRGDSLALAAGLLPTEYRRLCQLDSLAQMAEEKGRADGEAEAAGQLRDAARNGDAKAALAILTHVHGWVAKQQVQIDVQQRISITAALQEAESRVLNGRLLQAESPALIPTVTTDSHADAHIRR